MVEARVDGRPASLEAAVAEAAACLGRARFPVVAGLASDVAAVKAAIALARALRCPFDHLASGASLAELNVMRTGGWMQVSPGEVTRSCDLVLSAGRSLSAEQLARLFPNRGAPEHLHIAANTAAADLAVLRARLAGQPVKATERLEAMAEKLKLAKFGVAVWASGELEEPAIEMLMGLVRDRNAETRFSALPPAAPNNGAGANLVAGWLTGFPVRTSFGRGEPEHDPWVHDAERLIRTGAADAALFLSSFRAVLPDWRSKIPTVALVASSDEAAPSPHVLIEVGVPGIDHDGVLYNEPIGALAPVTASAPSDKPRASTILDRILAALSAKEQAA
jgi:formylmethanofuran dehydrogenase subunit B